MTAGFTKPVRLIARLDIKGTNLIKGIHMEGLRIIGSPNEKARHYYHQGADELLYMDAVASLYNRSHLAELVTEVVQDVFIPITVGGGIRSVSDVKQLLRAGAEKVAINTAAVGHPSLLTNVAESFGSQCVVLSIEAKKRGPGSWEVYVEGGREKTGRDVFEWLEEAVDLGAGEVLITSIDQDGTEKGFDIDLMQRASLISKVPVIASGGMGVPGHAAELLKNTEVDAVAVARSLHYDRLSLPDLRQTLHAEGYGVRGHEPV
jgi:imidazole glycerol-phosphate synthase subunit HisF